MSKCLRVLCFGSLLMLWLVGATPTPSRGDEISDQPTVPEKPDVDRGEPTKPAAISQPDTSASQPDTNPLEAAKPEPVDNLSVPEEKPAKKPIPGPVGFESIFPGEFLWIDLKRKLVAADGTICLREGMLEMFACTKGTKEHESILAIDTKAQFLHTALLAVGAVTGNTVKWDPKYVPASGTPIDIYVLWRDENGKRQQVRAQEWIREISSGKQMAYSWVFAGSSFWVDEETGQRHYQAEAGDVICVSNFSTAMLDLPVESSQANAGLQFDAFTEHIPARGTRVRLIFVPRLPKPSPAETESKPAPNESES